LAKEGELVANESEQAVIDLIRRHHKSGKSLGVIANYLNQNGYSTKQGKQWYPTTVKNVLDRLKNNSSKR
jgi:hypothetical protein